MFNFFSRKMFKTSKVFLDKMKKKIEQKNAPIQKRFHSLQTYFLVYHFGLLNLNFVKLIELLLIYFIKRKYTNVCKKFNVKKQPFWQDRIESQANGILVQFNLTAFASSKKIIQFGFRSKYTFVTGG